MIHVHHKWRQADHDSKNKRGLWALKKFEHPADYKKRIKAADSAGETAAASEAIAKGAAGGRGIWGFVRRIFGR